MLKRIRVLIFCSLLPAVPVVAAVSLDGSVRDSSGAVVPGARVEIRSVQGNVLAVRQTDSTGRFEWRGPEHLPGHFQVRASAGSLSAAEAVVYLDDAGGTVEIVLRPRSLFSHVVVSATPGGAEESAFSPHVVVTKDLEQAPVNPMPTVGNVLEREPGILVQQSTYGQVSPFLRGLTGYQVLNVVDGIRFNNSTFRSGPNQYLAFVESMQTDRIEALLGPAASQHGSDSLGGTIQVRTPQPRFAESGGRRIRGSLTLGGGTADASAFIGGRLAAEGSRTFWLGGLSGRKHNDLRAGGGFDSHNVFHRLFGMSLPEVRKLVGGRQQDTGFSQYGLLAKFASNFSASQYLTVHYQRSRQDAVRGYKDLLGGLGRLVSDLEPQQLNWFYLRYEKLAAGPLDSVTGTLSLNSQADGSVRQNLQFTDPVTRDVSRVDSYGYAFQGTTHRGRRFVASFGGELYDEHISSEREVRNPESGAVTYPRPLYPNRSRYLTFGAFGQGSVNLASNLRAAGGVRFTSVRFNTPPQASFGIPRSNQTFRDTTFHASLVWQLAGPFGLHGVVSRGFRAPNLNDLGALGLNDLGYEVPAAEAIPAGALLSTDAGEGAVSKGVPVETLSSESLLNYEFGFRFRSNRLSARLQFFDAELHDPIVRRTLLFSESRVPTQLAGLPVTPLPPIGAQEAQGVVAVATPLDPRAVKSFVNDGRSRYYGLESLARFVIRGPWSLEAAYAYLVGRDLNPNRNVRRLPPQMGSAALRYVPAGNRPWFELALAAAGRQDRLSGGDRDDERIGASFRRRDIADFFNGGRVAPHLESGVFGPTGESLPQIQDRVLPIGGVVNGVKVVDDSTRVPLYLSTRGWATVSVRSGVRLGESYEITGSLENLLDRNYRIHGSGVDSPGLGLQVVLRYRF